MENNEIGLYIHIPFCVKKCLYCDFISYENRNELVEEYIHSLKQEIINYKDCNKYTISTIYIGGGTPSFINSKYITQIIETIGKTFRVKENAEITIEINPGTVTEQKLKDYKNCGINRVSIGLQSTDNKILKQIGRIHTYEQFLDTYKLARKIGFNNINIDLMLALPNQTLTILEDSINKVIELNPEHISIYSLILEEGTPLYNLVESKKMHLSDDETERKMYWLVKKKLEERGYKQYEISNFAKQGYESKHNISCWEQKEYIGFGVAAHSYISGIRYSNTSNLHNYIRNVSDLQTIQTIQEIQNKEEQMKEYMILGLRKIEGVQISEFKNKFIQNPLYIFMHELDKLVKEELIEIDENSIKLTKKGLDFANIVWEEFV